MSHANVLTRNIPAGRATRVDTRPLLVRRPMIGIGLAIIGGLVFGILAYNVRTNGPLLA